MQAATRILFIRVAHEMFNFTFLHPPKKYICKNWQFSRENDSFDAKFSTFVIFLILLTITLSLMT